ncbi:MAG TPA: hypothetical protein VJN21_10945, partial [Candidatus Acidoferrales bacterium]|nr:hypothetical protein [Candidatus Acidoferrales bacterium]
MRTFFKFVSRNGTLARGEFWQIGSLVLVAVVLIVLATLRIFIMPLAHVLTQSASGAASPPSPIWVMSSLVRVGQSDAPGTTSSITLSGARGETVDSQVIVHAPAGGLTH